MIEAKEKEIEGCKVTVSQFPARYGFKLQVKLAGIFGPVLGEVLSGVKGGKNFSQSDINMEKLSDAIRVLFEKINQDTALDLILEILKSTHIDGKEITPETFDIIFVGKYGLSARQTDSRWI